MASQCLYCSKFLWKVLPLKIDDIPPLLLSELDRVRLENGRAFVASLVHERIESSVTNVTDVQVGLKVIENYRLLAVGTHLNITYFRRANSACVVAMESQRSARATQQFFESMVRSNARAT